MNRIGATMNYFLIGCFFIFLQGCASGGSSAGLASIQTAPPPPSTTPGPAIPEWSGISYREDDPNSEQWAEFNYNRISLDEFKSTHDKNNMWKYNGNDDYQRTNFGLLNFYGTGWHEGNSQGFEQHDSGCCYNISMAPSVISGDFNGDGLTDVVYAHRTGPSSNMSWQPSTRLIVLINQGNGELHVDPSIMVDNEFAAVGGLFESHVADFNGDGVDDFINIGMEGKPGYLLSNNGKLENKSDYLFDTLFNIGGHDEAGNFSVAAHTSAIGDLNGDGFIDMFVPAHLRDQGCTAIYGCSGFTIHNDGTGNFSFGSVNMPYVGNALASTIEDFDGDGFGDIAISMPTVTPGHVFFDQRLCDLCSGFVMYGNSDLDYTRDISLLPNYNNVGDIGLQFTKADFDGDGDYDLLLITTGGGEGTNGYYSGSYLMAFTNNGTERTWTDSSSSVINISNFDSLPKHHNSGLQPTWFQHIDIDGDGDLDLWSTGGYYTPYYINDNGVYVLAGVVGDVLPFMEPCNNNEGCGTNTRYNHAIDIDGDGIMDFIQSSEYGDTNNSGVVVSQLMGRSQESQQAFAVGVNGINAYRESGSAGQGFTDNFLNLINNLSQAPSTLLNIDDMIFTATAEFNNTASSMSMGVNVKQSNTGTQALSITAYDDWVFGYGFQTNVQQLKGSLSSHQAQTTSMLAYIGYDDLYSMFSIHDVEIRNQRNTLLSGVAKSDTDALAGVFTVAKKFSMFDVGIDYTHMEIEGFNEQDSGMNFIVKDATVDSVKGFVQFNKNILGIDTIIKYTHNINHNPYRVVVETADNSFYGAIDPVNTPDWLWFKLSKTVETNWGTFGINWQDYAKGPKAQGQFSLDWNWRF